MPEKWALKWDIEGNHGSYVVSMDDNGGFACSCPRWKFFREECKHIRKVKSWQKE